ncbi:hypothetical protein IV203_026814 [Nitzschia inconspicua]|uniref:Uncharacterized protein n=1 Tax=Nitzschia inconspicua TaxID=303405 RepID=A0A9K3LJ98_9STRA|nr:hypothetical protein IV203_026814 [Nitzschia inconspicua]
MASRRITVLIVFLSSSLPWSGEAFSNPSGCPYGSYTSSSVGGCTQHSTQSHPFKRKKSRHAATFRTPSALLLRESLREGGQRRKQRIATVAKGANSSRNRRWHRRLFSKLLLRQDATPAVTPLRMTVMDEETEALLDSIAMYSEELILGDFDSITPSDVLSEAVFSDKVIQEDKSKEAAISSMSASMVDSEFYDVAISPAPRTSQTRISNPTNKSSRSSRSRSLSFPRLLAALFEKILTSRVVNNALEEPENFRVEVEPLENTMSRLLLKGQFRANAKISTGRLVFRPIRFSKGTLELEEVTLNLLGFLQQPTSQPKSSDMKKDSTKQTTGDGVVRYPKQFDIHVQDLTMTRHDLLFSPCVKNGLRRLLINILKDRGVQSSSIRITSIDILSSGKISCVGDAKTHFGSPIPFEVRSGISFANRGHVLTFPGLEVSLNRDLGLFVPVVPTIDLDVGHNAVFRRIRIDGKRKEIQVDASVTITPDRTIRLMKKYVQSSEAFAARFSYDVGQWLTRLGRFTE